MLLFNARRKEKEVQRALVRLVNQHTGDLHDNVRLESRVCLTAAVVIVPWVDGSFDTSSAINGVTKEFSSTGASLAVSARLDEDDLAVGMKHDGAMIFFRGQVMHRDELGGGFWVLGMRFNEVIDLESHPALRSISI